jgi:hypothetical protein
VASITSQSEIKKMKTINELRSSAYHEQLGQKLFAAFLAQQQGISLNTALKKVEGPVSDAWLIVAEFARQAYHSSVEDILTNSGQERLGTRKM